MNQKILEIIDKALVDKDPKVLRKLANLFARMADTESLLKALFYSPESEGAACEDQTDLPF